MEMVRAILDGQNFLGLPTTSTNVVYLTEQPEVSFRQAMERARLLGREDFHYLLFGQTLGVRWSLLLPRLSLDARECAAASW